MRKHVEEKKTLRFLQMRLKRGKTERKKKMYVARCNSARIVKVMKEKFD
jgi:hypothetical protein